MAEEIQENYPVPGRDRGVGIPQVLGVRIRVAVCHLGRKEILLGRDLVVKTGLVLAESVGIVIVVILARKGVGKWRIQALEEIGKA